MVVVRAVVGQHLDDHAGLDLRQRIRVDDAVRQCRPVLVGDQRERLHQGLVGGGQRGPPGDQLAQLGHGPAVEHVPHREVETLRPQRAHERDSANRVSAEVEEAVVHADPFDLQSGGPHLGDLLLDGRPGRDVLAVGERVEVR